MLRPQGVPSIYFCKVRVISSVQARACASRFDTFELCKSSSLSQTYANIQLALGKIAFQCQNALPRLVPLAKPRQLLPGAAMCAASRTSRTQADACRLGNTLLQRVMGRVMNCIEKTRLCVACGIPCSRSTRPAGMDIFKSTPSQIRPLYALAIARRSSELRGCRRTTIFQ
jgi:hypothetical protein